MMRRPTIPYSGAEMRWLESNRAMIISDYHRAFCAAFARSDVTAAHLHGLRKRMGWKVGRAPGRYVGRHQLFSGAEIEWLRSNCTKERDEYHHSFCAAFSRLDVSSAQLNALRKRKRWRTGRDGRFEQGSVPANKGKPRAFNENSARTQFTKGHPRTGVAAEIYKPIGSERIHEGGYRERKIHDGFPMQSRWKFAHRIEWEKVNGPIPEGMVLKCKGDPLETDPSNWECVPRGLLPRLNNRWGRNYDVASGDLKPTIMAVAKLEHRIREKRR
jgi:hypothetical protein